MANDTPFFTAPNIHYQADSCESLKVAELAGEVAVSAWSHAPYPGTIVNKRFPPAIRSVGAWDATGEQSWGLEEHFNEGIEFTLLRRGQTAFTADGKSYLLDQDLLTITRPWQRHSVGNPNIQACQLYWLILDVEVRRPNQTWRWPEWLLLSSEELNTLTRLLSLNEHVVWRANTGLIDAFDQLIHIVKTESPDSSLTRMKISINSFLVQVLELLSAKAPELNDALPSAKRTVKLFLEELHAQPQHDWSLESMAERCGLSRTRFSHYCREITNMTPGRYLTHCRLNRAIKLMDKKAVKSITELAFSCGFNSSQYFSTCFQAQYKTTPSAYFAQLES